MANHRSTRYENETVVCLLRSFRVIYLILDCCKQTTRILTNRISTRYENETVVCLLRGFRMIYLILDCCRGYADRQGLETRGGIKP